MSESRIKEHMEVIGADGVYVGTVDRVENGKIKAKRFPSKKKAPEIRLTGLWAAKAAAPRMSSGNAEPVCS